MNNNSNSPAELKISNQASCQAASSGLIRTALVGSVRANVGVLADLDTGSNTLTALVVAGLRNTSISPDAPGTLDAVGAGNQVLSTELQVVVRVDGPALAFTVLGGGLSAGGVSDHALACSKSINISYKVLLITR